MCGHKMEKMDGSDGRLYGEPKLIDLLRYTTIADSFSYYLYKAI